MTQPNETLIHVENLHKVFITEEVETHALAGIHLSINQGEYVSIAGPSGCGKSTLMAILGLLDSPTEGEYRLAGEPVANLWELNRWMAEEERAHFRRFVDR